MVRVVCALRLHIYQKQHSAFSLISLRWSLLTVVELPAYKAKNRSACKYEEHVLNRELVVRFRLQGVDEEAFPRSIVIGPSSFSPNAAWLGRPYQKGRAVMTLDGVRGGALKDAKANQ